MFVKINGRQHYLWWVVGQDGEVVDVFLQARRDGAPARRIFMSLLRGHGGDPRKTVTDKLRSHGVAQREIIPETIHDKDQYVNSQAEQSHEATGFRERGTREFKSTRQALRFLGMHAAVSSIFNLGRRLVSAEHYRNFRKSAFTEWNRPVT